MSSKAHNHSDTAFQVLAAVLSGLLLLATPAEAETSLPMAAAEGGNPNRVDCDPGSYVVGFKARAGDWMDQISIVCGRWSQVTQTLQSAAEGTVKEPFGDSTGGEELSASCPNGWAVSSYKFRYMYEEFFVSGTHKSSRPKFLHAVEFHCRPALPGSGQTVVSTIGSSSGGKVSAFKGPFDCPPRELVTAMYGRAGQFVDAIGMICNLRPEPAPPGVETKLPDSAVIKPKPFEDKLDTGGVIAAPQPSGGGDNVLPQKPVGKQGDNVLPQKPVGRPTATVIADVDVYKQAGGEGKLGVLNSNNNTTKVSLVEPCQDNWCHVKGDAVPTGEGWVYSGTPPDFQSLQF